MTQLKAMRWADAQLVNHKTTGMFFDQQGRCYRNFEVGHTLG